MVHLPCGSVGLPFLIRELLRNQRREAAASICLWVRNVLRLVGDALGLLRAIDVGCAGLLTALS